MKLPNQQAPAHLSRTFTGTYRLTGRVVEFDNAKTPFLKLRLSDCEGDRELLSNSVYGRSGGSPV